MEEWCRAPEEVMQQTLAHIDAKYGSLAAYCTSIGFSPAEQAALCAALTGAGPGTPPAPAVPQSLAVNAGSVQVDAAVFHRSC